MRRPAALYDIRHLLTAQLPDLPSRLRAALALWVEGTLLGLNGCQDTVTLALAHCLKGPRNPHTLRRLQRELLYDDADRIDSWGPGQELEVEGCFAPLLRWVRSWWVPTGGRELAQEPLVLAVDPTSKQDDLVALVISVVYRQHAHPGGPRVAWHIVGAQAKGSWIDHFCRLLRLLAPAVPATVPVHGLCDQGLGSRDLWAQIVALGWHPCLRYQPHVTFQPEGQTSRVPVRSLITGPGGLWVGTGRAFRDQPLKGTLIVLQAYGQAQPWVLLTDTPVAETEPTLYACRNWIEQGFRGLKTVGWKWHRTRRLDPTRVGRHWLVLAIATLLAVAYGTRREEAEARHREPRRRVDSGPAGGPATPPPQPVAAGRGATAPLAAARLSVGLRVAAPDAGSRLPHAPAASGPRRHLNLPALPARDPHRTPPSLSPHPGRLGPPHPAARHTGPAAPTAPFCPHNAADSGPSRAWPCPARGGSTDPDTPTDSRPENTLVKRWGRSSSGSPDCWPGWL